MPHTTHAMDKSLKHHLPANLDIWGYNSLDDVDCYLDDGELGADRLHALGRWSPTVDPAFDAIRDDEIALLVSR